MNKNIFILIGIVIVAAIAVIVWRSTQPAENPQTNPQVTPTSTPTLTVETPTPTETLATTPTPSVTTTVTPTPTTSISSGSTFDQGLNTGWVYGLTEQTVSGQVYFIDSSNPMVIKKGSSKTDTSAQVVFTSDGGDVGSFNVLGSTIIIALKRNTSNNETRLVKYTPSSSRTVLLYKYISSKFDVVEFTIPKDSTTEFYLGLNGVDQKYQPMVMYVKQYAQVWTKTVDGTLKTDTITAMAPITDLTSLKVKVTPTSGDDKVILVSTAQP